MLHRVDGLFVDAKRARVYVSCGAGFIDVFETIGTTYRHMARIPTLAGARTSLFVPEMDRLLVAVRAGPAGPAATGSHPTRVALTCRGTGSASFANARAR